jgi:hypothetical protein
VFGVSGERSVADLGRLRESQRRVYGLVCAGVTGLADLADFSGYPTIVVLNALRELTAAGLVECEGGRWMAACGGAATRVNAASSADPAGGSRDVFGVGAAESAVQGKAEAGGGGCAVLAGSGFRRGRGCGSWRLVSVEDPRTPPRPGWRRAGPWRSGEGTPMHGLYERPAADGLVDGVAVCEGWPVWWWRGPRMPRFRSPLVSSWNPILAQALSADKPWYRAWFGFRREFPVDWNEWTAAALADGLKPYGYLDLPRREAGEWAARVRAAGLEAEGPTRSGLRWGFAAARTETYGELFDLGALVADYRAVLPAELAGPEAAALLAHAGRRPADYLGVGGFAALENGPSSVCGLTLGYPPSVTAGLLLRQHEHGRAQWGLPAETGALLDRV